MNKIIADMIDRATASADEMPKPTAEDLKECGKYGEFIKLMQLAVEARAIVLYKLEEKDVDEADRQVLFACAGMLKEGIIEHGLRKVEKPTHVQWMIVRSLHKISEELVETIRELDVLLGTNSFKTDK